jgi:hypothetical protein
LCTTRLTISVCEQQQPNMHLITFVALAVLVSSSLALSMKSADELPSTGWSNGMTPGTNPPLWNERYAGTSASQYHTNAVCSEGSFINQWTIGVAVVDPEKTNIQSIVSVQGQCSDGHLLDAIEGSVVPTTVLDNNTASSLQSATGYTCAQLVSKYYIGDGKPGWMIQFLGLPSNPDAQPNTATVNLNCDSIPASYVAVGNHGVKLWAVDGMKFFMAAPQIGRQDSSGQAATTSPASPAPASSHTPSNCASGSTCANILGPNLALSVTQLLLQANINASAFLKL